MKKFYVLPIILLVLITVAIVRPIHCEEELGGPFENTIGGKVISVDAQNSQIVVKTFENFIFSVAPDAKIINQDGFDIQLKEISVGNYVTVDYRDSSGAHIATDIEVDYEK